MRRASSGERPRVDVLVEPLGAATVSTLSTPGVTERPPRASAPAGPRKVPAFLGAHVREAEGIRFLGLGRTTCLARHGTPMRGRTGKDAASTRRGSAASTFDPQARQKRASSGSSFPQVGQATLTLRAPRAALGPLPQTPRSPCARRAQRLPRARPWPRWSVRLAGGAPRSRGVRHRER